MLRNVAGAREVSVVPINSRYVRNMLVDHFLVTLMKICVITYLRIICFTYALYNIRDMLCVLCIFAVSL